jgi:hypothetical protein
MATVTVQMMKDAGYPVGALKDDPVIGLAEKDVRMAYFPDDETFEDEEAFDLLTALTFCMLLKRRTVASRYGSVQKVSRDTVNAASEQIRDEIRGYTIHRLERYATARPDFEPTDILEIFDNLFLS